jgi:hypothetical protein
MKKINDKKIYLSMMFIPLLLAVFLGGVSLYSRLIVEPRVKKLLASESTFKEAYLLLREPQVFAGYKYWDSDGMAVKNTLRYFDNKLFNGYDIKPDELIYLELVFKRRVSGSELGIKSSLFFLIISFAGSVAYIIERRSLLKS